MEYQSRRSRKLLEDSKKRLVYSVLGTILVLFLLVKFGMPALIKFSVFIGTMKSSGQSPITNQSPSFVAAPILLQTFTATNSAQISVNGTATSKEIIDLYLNNNLVDTTTTKDDGTFSFDTVTLSDGSNTIQAKAKLNNKESDFSNQLSITYANKQPTLEVTNPSDGQSFSQNTVSVTGKTDPDDKVTINDFWAIVDDNGNFSYIYTLKNGDNQLKVIATDQAGNKTEKDLTVKYSQ